MNYDPKLRRLVADFLNGRVRPNVIGTKIEDVCPMTAPSQSSGSNEYRWTPITRTLSVSSMTSSSKP